MVESLPILHSSTGRDPQGRKSTGHGALSHRTAAPRTARRRTACVVRRRPETDIAPATVAHYRAAHALGRLAIRRYREAAALGREQPSSLCLAL